MVNGVIRFEHSGELQVRRFVREMTPKVFGVGQNQGSIDDEEADLARQLEGHP